MLIIENYESKLAAADLEAAVWKAEQPRSPWDRGSKSLKILRAKESLTEMMARLSVPPKARWTTPTMLEQPVCDNCDGAPDGGHTDELPCGRQLEDMGYQPNPYL